MPPSGLQIFCNVWPWPLTFWIWVVVKQLAFTVICACQVSSKFDGQFLRYLTESNFCDLFQHHINMLIDLLTQKVKCFVPLSHLVYLCQFTAKSVHLLSKYCSHKTGNKTDKWITQDPATLAWRGKQTRDMKDIFLANNNASYDSDDWNREQKLLNNEINKSSATA